MTSSTLFYERLHCQEAFWHQYPSDIWGLPLVPQKEIRLQINHHGQSLSHFIRINISPLLNLIYLRKRHLENVMKLTYDYRSSNAINIIVNEQLKNENLCKHVKNFSTFSYLSEFQMNGWEDLVKLSIYHGEVTNDIFQILQPPLLIPYRLDKLGYAQDCSICSNHGLFEYTHPSRVGPGRDDFRQVYRYIVNKAFRRKARRNIRDLDPGQTYYESD